MSVTAVVVPVRSCTFRFHVDFYRLVWKAEKLCVEFAFSALNWILYFNGFDGWFLSWMDANLLNFSYCCVWLLLTWIAETAVNYCCSLEWLILLWIIVAGLNGLNGSCWFEWFEWELLVWMGVAGLNGLNGSCWVEWFEWELLVWMVWMGVAGLNGLNGSCWVEWLFMVHIRVANGYASQELWFVLCVWFLFKLHCHSKTF